MLELVGDDVDRGGEAGQFLFVFIGGAAVRMRDMEGAELPVGRVNVAAQSERRCGQRQHAGKLAAAENADGVADFKQVHFSWRTIFFGNRCPLFRDHALVFRLLRNRRGLLGAPGIEPLGDFGIG